MFLLPDAVGKICLDVTVRTKPLGEGSSGGQEKVSGARYSPQLSNMLYAIGKTRPGNHGS